jgi:hypothetical protein
MYFQFTKFVLRVSLVFYFLSFINSKYSPVYQCSEYLKKKSFAESEKFLSINFFSNRRTYTSLKSIIPIVFISYYKAILSVESVLNSFHFIYNLYDG